MGINIWDIVSFMSNKNFPQNTWFRVHFQKLGCEIVPYVLNMIETIVKCFIFQKGRKQFSVQALSTLLSTANQLQFYKHSESSAIQPFLVDILWGFLLVLTEEKGRSENFSDQPYVDIRNSSLTFIHSDTNNLKDFCSDVSISLKGMNW